MTTHYRDEKLGRAREIAAQVASAPDVDSVYLSGSLAADLGSPTSDVDIFVILAEGAEPQVEMRQILVGTERIDIEYYRPDQFRSALDRCLDWQTTRENMTPAWVPEAELDLIIRLHYAMVIKDSPFLEEIRARLHDRGDKLRQLLLCRWAMRANNHLEDFVGAYSDGDLDTAALIGSSLMLAAGKAVAASAGDLYFGHKWVFRQVRRSAPHNFPYGDFKRFMLGTWIEDPVHGYEDFMWLLQTSLVAAQLLGWEEPRGTEWTNWTKVSGHPHRSTDLLPIRLTSGVLLNDERRRQVVVPPHIALVWGLADGRPLDEVAESAAEIGMKFEPYSSLNEERSRSLLAKAAERRLFAP